MHRTARRTGWRLLPAAFLLPLMALPMTAAPVAAQAPTPTHDDHVQRHRSTAVVDGPR